MSLPVSMVVFRGTPIGAEIERRYPLGPVHQCYLLRAAINHFYVLRAGDRRFAVRVSLGNWRSEQQTTFEIDFQNHLLRNGIVVPRPVRANDGSYYFQVNSEEGPHTVVVYEWAKEVELLRRPEPEHLRRFGKIIADAHRIVGDFRTSTLEPFRLSGDIQNWAPMIEPYLFARDDDLRLLRSLCSTLLVRVQREDVGEVPWSVLHGDLHIGNALICDRNIITLLDFDFCGRGPLIYDIASYLWGSEQLGIRRDVSEHFVRGYEDVRPLTSSERETLPIMLVAKSIWWLGLRASLVDRLGSTTFAKQSLDSFFGRLRRDCRAAGLGD